MSKAKPEKEGLSIEEQKKKNSDPEEFAKGLD
jgi:hypothetical protein